MIDWIVVIACAVIAGAVYTRPPTNEVLFRAGPEGTINNDQFMSYPVRDEIIPTWLSAVIAVGANYIIFIIAWIIDRNHHSLHHAVLGTAMSLALSTIFQVGIKNIIGGVRPTFLEKCQPDYTKAEGKGYGGVWYDRSICTNSDSAEVNDALESFPSGHSNAAFAGLLFLAFWMNARLKVFAHRRGRNMGLKLLAVFIPLWAACILSLTRLVDHNHNWYDILCGAIIGMFFATACYRAYFQALFDPRVNHIPLIDPDEANPDTMVDSVTGRPIELDRVAAPVGPAAV